MAAIEKYVVPRTLQELTGILADRDATLLAGGTDLMPQTQSGARAFRSTLVNIRRVDELHGIRESNGDIRIGALATITEILESPLLREKALVLAQAADCFACTQIRNIATVGGNLCNASPAGDMIIPLLLLGAQVRLASWADGGVVRRSLPLCDFFVAPGKTRIRAPEVLTEIRFKVPDPAAVGFFRKLATRPALDIAVVSVGIFGIRDNGCLRGVRAAFGAAAPTPVRGRRTEAALEGRALDAEGIATVAGAIEGDVSPISDVRASAWYRRRVLRRLTERILYDVNRKDDPFRVER